MGDVVKTRLPIKPFEASGKVHNHVRLRLDYDKRATGPVLYLQTVSYEPPTESSPFAGESFIIFGSPSTTFVMDRGWKTNSKKKLMLAWDRLDREFASKAGPAYEAVAGFLAQHESGLVQASESAVDLATRD
jgi:hypothetical protein